MADASIRARLEEIEKRDLRCLFDRAVPCTDRFDGRTKYDNIDPPDWCEHCRERWLIEQITAEREARSALIAEFRASADAENARDKSGWQPWAIEYSNGQAWGLRCCADRLAEGYAIHPLDPKSDLIDQIDRAIKACGVKDARPTDAKR